MQSGAALDGIGVSGRGGMTDNRQARGGIRIRIRSVGAGPRGSARDCSLVSLVSITIKHSASSASLGTGSIPEG